MESRQVSWTESALKDIQDIDTYISMSSPVYAQRVIEGIFEATQRLADFPYLGQAMVYKRVRLRQLSVRPYRVFYRVGQHAVEVVAVVHGARDIARALKGRV
jgi:toxin ParE1/3/4